MTAIKQEADVKIQSGENFTAVHCGTFNNLDAHKLEMPSLGRTVRGKLFVKDFLGMTGMQISMNKFPAGMSMPYYHQHKENEEAYIFIKGQGQMQVDGENIDVSEGSIVRVSTKGLRAIRNTGDGDIQFICIQAREGSLNIDTFDDGIRSEKPIEW